MTAVAAQPDWFNTWVLAVALGISGIVLLLAVVRR